jgi:ABC-type transporter Mla subunit MlaD
MSLGPPFDPSGERLRLGLGAAAGALLLFVTAVALLSADRSLGDSLRVYMLVRRPGALHAGALVQVAGLQIGEVVAIRGQGRDGEPESAAGLSPALGRRIAGLDRPLPQQECQALQARKRLPPPEPKVEVELRIQRRYADRVYENSTFLTVNPTVLTEGLIEVGPPDGGAAPAAPIRSGSRVRGVDPADLDDLIATVFCSTEEVMRIGRELRPAWIELSAAGHALFDRLQRTLDGDQFLRVKLQTVSAFTAADALRRKLERAGIGRTPAAVESLAQTIRALAPPLAAFAAQVGELQARSQALAGQLVPRRQRIGRLDEDLQRLQKTAERTEADGRYLLRLFERGGGTIGGFQQDLQIFDELKDMHRILKRQIWRVLIKRKGQKQAPLPSAPR